MPLSIYRIFGTCALLALSTATGCARPAVDPSPIKPKAAEPIPQFDVALTLDDGPFMGLPPEGLDRRASIGRIIDAVSRRNLPATLFATCRNIQSPDELAPYLRAGFEIGNHTTSHLGLTAKNEAEWLADARKCQAELTRRIGHAPLHFRYPMLHMGETAPLRDRVAKALGDDRLRIGHVSIDTHDWLLSYAYVKATSTAQRDAVARAYVDHILEATDHYRRVGRKLAGREVSQVLLLHTNALAADHLGTVLDALRGRGARFVPLPTALSDEVYSREDRYAGPIGLSALYRVAEKAEGAWIWDRGRELASNMRVGGRMPSVGKAIPIDSGLTVSRLADGAWVATEQAAFPANALVVRVADGSVVVASTLYTEERAGALLDWIAAAFERPSVTGIITHFHDDAAGGAAAFRKRGFDVVVAKETLARITPGYATGQAPNVTFALADGYTFPRTSARVRVLYPGPGHSFDNVAVWFEDQGLLFGGCMIRAQKGPGNTADANVKEWPRSIERLRDLVSASAPAVRFVVPGHGETGDASLFEHTIRQVERSK